MAITSNQWEAERETFNAATMDAAFIEDTLDHVWRVPIEVSDWYMGFELGGGRVPSSRFRERGQRIVDVLPLYAAVGEEPPEEEVGSVTRVRAFHIPDTPFHQLKGFRVTRLRHLILRARRSKRIAYASDLADRLEALLDVVQEEMDEEANISVESLENLITFLETEKELIRPRIVLTPRGNFRATWRKGPQQHFAVEFLSSGSARFVVFGPDLHYPDLTAREAGVVSREALMESVGKYHVLSWAS